MCAPVSALYSSACARVDWLFSGSVPARGAERQGPARDRSQHAGRVPRRQRRRQARHTAQRRLRGTGALRRARSGVAARWAGVGKVQGPEFRGKVFFRHSENYRTSGARFTKYLTTILQLSYDNAKVTIDLRRRSNLQKHPAKGARFFLGTIHLQNCKIVLDCVRKLAYDIPKRNFSTF